MKIILVIKRYLGSCLFFPLMLFGISQPALATCVQSYSSSDVLQSATVIGVDGNNGCVDIPGQYGCSVKNPVVGSSCTFNDGNYHFTATVTAFDSRGLRWDVTNNNTNIDTFQIKGASKGINNCVTSYTYEDVSGSGGDCTSFDAGGTCLSYSGAGGIDFCSDLIAETPPPPPVLPEKLSFCQDPNADPSALGMLDETGIKCPTYTAEDQANGDIPDGYSVGDQKQVVVCNLEKWKQDWGATDGSDLCCQCGIPLDQQTACVVTEDRSQCTQSISMNPTQSVELIFNKDDLDPSTWIYTSQGWKLITY